MKFIQYLRDVKSELKHVSWPTKRQAIALTALVIVVSVITAAFLGAFDYGFSTGLKNIIEKTLGY